MRKWQLAVAGATALLFAAACSDKTVTDPGTRGIHPRNANGNNPVSGAGFTTVNENVDGTGHCKNGNPNTNCNIYDDKQYVWLNGGPSVAYVGDGTYFFAVLDPGGQADPNDGAARNLSDDFDAYTNRTFSVSAGTVSYGGSHTFNSNKIRLADYATTSNPGGVYILAICSLAGGYPVNASDCKYDAFKIQKEGTVTELSALTVTKDATGAYDNKYKWTITKDVDKTTVKQIGGSVTFTYTVNVSHDGGKISNVKVSGTISVFNPNVDANSQVIPVDIDGVTDQLSDGTVCTVTNGGSQTLTQLETKFSYSCDLSGVPQGQLDNTAAVAWSEQFLNNGAHLAGGSADFTFSDISFTENTIDESINVTDSFKGTLGTVSVSDANPTTFTYTRTVSVVADQCVSYDNTATFTTIDTGATGSASQTVTVCGGVAGGLTMGFWQNKNGQGIISGQAKTGTCPSATWLVGYAPFQDLSATSTCAQVATYVYNVIKAANASGAAMNAMLKGQMLATALDVYFSDPSLGGNKINAPAPIGGVKVDLTQICKMIDGSGGTSTCSGTYQNVSAAFGGATALTVSNMLTYAAGQSNPGGSIWYGQVKATQELAKNAFDAINNGVAFTAP